MDDIQQLIDAFPVVEFAPPQTSRSSSASPTAEPVDDLENYRHVPFQAVGTRRVSYEKVEPLSPRKVEYVEDDE